MPSLRLLVNGTERVVPDVDPSTPLLWVLRDQLGLTGTKFGCGMSLCGACTVHIDGAAARSCSIPAATLEGKKIVTIEGLAANAQKLHPLQEAWIEHDVAQCGYCQAGQIMSAAALLQQSPNPSDEDINRMMSANLCRCGTYQRIHAAIRTAAEKSATPATAGGAK